MVSPLRCIPIHLNFVYSYSYMHICTPRSFKQIYTNYMWCPFGYGFLCVRRRSDKSRQQASHFCVSSERSARGKRSYPELVQVQGRPHLHTGHNNRHIHTYVEDTPISHTFNSHFTWSAHVMCLSSEQQNTPRFRVLSIHLSDGQILCVCLCVACLRVSII